MTQLYVTPLPDSQAHTSDEGVRAQIQQSGLLQEGGTATEKISQENIDLVVEGKFDFGARFSRKVADELESLGESEYSGVEFYDPDASDSGRNSGFYEVGQVDVAPSHPVNQDAFTYTCGLKFTGTRETHWRAISTNEETIGTGIATGSSSLIGIPAESSKVRWFTEAAGAEVASVSRSVTAEFGSVDLYDPTATPLTNPTLLYELPYSAVGSVDVRVYDDRALSKYYTLVDGTTTTSAYGSDAYGSGVYGGSSTSGGTEVSQWTHVYHTSYEFEGDPVVDNGRLRLRFDETNDAVEFYEYTNGSWSEVTVSHADYELIDAELTRIGPADVRAYVEFQNTSDGSLRQAELSVQRGLDSVLAREPDNETWTSGFETYLDQYCGNYTTDNNPSRGLQARSGVK